MMQPSKSQSSRVITVQNFEFRADYVTEMVRQEMVKRFGEEDAYTKGYKVFTTVLSKDQAEAQKSRT